MLTLKVDDLEWPVTDLRYERLPLQPDRWLLRLEARGLSYPEPDAKATLWAGQDELTRFRLTSVVRAWQTARVAATRVAGDGVDRPVPVVQQGPLTSVLGHLCPWLAVSAAARQALGQVELHSCRPPVLEENSGQWLRWVLGCLASELGIALSLHCSAEGKVELRDPVRDGPVATLRDGQERRGTRDPWRSAPLARTVLEHWDEPCLERWPQAWQALESAAEVERGGDDLLLLSHFRASWSRGDDGHAGGASPRRQRQRINAAGSAGLHLQRRWTSQADMIRTQRRQQSQATGWTRTALMGKQTSNQEQHGPYFAVRPLEWYGDGWRPASGAQLVCRLLTAYGGASPTDCGLHLVPDPKAIVLVTTRSVFSRPVILGEVRHRNVKSQDFGLFLPGGKNLELRADSLKVFAQSEFGPRV